jgi:hypothetical protein
MYKKKIDKQKLKQILAASNAHAVPHLVGNQNKCLKLIWLFMFVVSICACYYFLSKTLIDYFSYTKVTSIHLINKQPSLFPTVTICNRRDHGLPLENITLCQTNYDTDCQNKPQNYFESFIDSYYGQCLRFNSGKNFKGEPIELLKGYYGSSNDGLWLNFKLNSVDRFGKLMVIIHNHTIPPLNMANEDVKISPGRTNYITVHRTVLEKLEHPYSDCLKDPNTFQKNKTLINYLAKSGRAYSQKQCFELCFNLKYYETNPCNCTFNPWDQVFVKCYVSVDIFSKLYKCSEQYRTDFSEDHSFEKRCSELCPLECDSIDYSLTTYTLDYPSVGNISKRDKSKHFNSKFRTYEEIHRNFYSLVIYYKDLKYTLIKEEPNMILADLISNIGGLMGVFTGLSFISFVEIIELLFACLSGKKNKKQIQKCNKEKIMFISSV